MSEDDTVNFMKKLTVIYLYRKMAEIKMEEYIHETNKERKDNIEVDIFEIINTMQDLNK